MPNPATQDARSASPPKRKRRWRRRLLKCFAAFVLLLVVVYVFRQPLLGSFVARKASEALSDALGAPVQIDRVLGSWVGDVSIQGLRTTPGTRSGAVQELSADSIWIDFDLWDLVSGDYIAGIEGVQIKDLQVVVDPSKAPPKEDEEPGASIAQIVAMVPGQFPPVDIAGDVVVEGEDGSVRLGGLSIASVGPREIAIDAERVVLPEPASDQGAFHATVRRDEAGIHWTCDTEIAGLCLAKATADKSGVVRALARAADGDLTVRLTDERASIRSSALQLQRLPEWVVAMIPLERARPNQGSVEIRVDVPAMEPIEATATIELRDLGFPQDRVDALDLSAQYRNGQLHVKRLSVQSEGSTLNARGVVLDPSQPLGIASLQHFELSVPDLRRFGEDLLDRPVAARIGIKSADGGHIQIDRLELAGQGIHMDARGSVRVSAAEGPESPLQGVLDIAWSGHAKGLSVGPIEVRGQLDTNGHLRGSFTSPVAAAQLDGADVVIRGVALSSVHAQARLENERLQLSTFEAKGAGLSLSANGTVDLSQEAIQNGQLRVDVSNLATLLPVLAATEIQHLAGTLRAKATVTGPYEKPTGNVDLTLQDIAVDGTRFGGLSVSADLAGEVVHVRSAQADGPWGDLRFAAKVEPAAHRAKLLELRGTHGKYPLEIAQPATLSWGDEAALRGLRLKTLGGEFRGDATLTPHLGADIDFADLDIGAVSDDVQGRASGRLRVGRNETTLALRVPDLRVRGHAGHLDLSATQGSNGIHVESLELHAGDALQASGSGTLPWQIDEKGVRALAVDRASFDLHVLAADLKRIIEGPVSGGELNVEIRGPHIVARGHANEISAHPGLAPVPRADFEVKASGDHVSASVAIVGDDRVSAELEASTSHGWQWNHPDRLPESFTDVPVNAHVDVSVPDLGVLEALVPDGLINSLTGSLAVDVTIDGTIGAPKFDGAIAVSGARTELPDVPHPVIAKHIDLEFEDRVIRLQRAGVTYQSATVTATGAFEMPSDPTGDWTSRSLEARIKLAITDASTFAPFVRGLRDLRGRIDGDFKLDGTLTAPTYAGTVRGKALGFGLEDPVLDVAVPELAVRVDEQRVVLEGARVRSGNATVGLSGWVQVPEDLSAVSATPFALAVRTHLPDLSLIHEIAPQTSDVQAAVRTDLVVRGTLDRPVLRGPVVLDNVRYVLPEKDEEVRIPRVRVEASRGRVRLVEAQAQLRDARVALTGHVDVPDSGLTGDWSTQPLEARAQIDVPTLQVLGLAQERLAKLAGSVRGQVLAQGTVNSPALSGRIDLQGIAGRVSDGTRLDNVNGAVVLRDRAVHLEGFRGELGRSPFTLETRVDVPEQGDPRLDVRLRGDHLQLLRTDDTRMRANVDLRVKGPLSRLVASGRLDIADVVYAARMDLLDGGGPASAGSGDRIDLFSIEDGPLRDLQLNIAIRADRTIRVRTSTLKGDVSADLRLLGTGLEPALDGTVSFPGMLVKLPFSSLKVDAGEANFERARPGRPRIQAQAHTEMKGHELNVQALGVYPDVEVKVSSSPPLPQHEAFLLLTTGATSQQLEREGIARAALTRLASVFGKRLFAGGPEDPDEKSIFDRFEFVQGRRISESGQETMEAEFEVNERMFLRVERDTYDDFNAGVVWRWKFK